MSNASEKPKSHDSSTAATNAGRPGQAEYVRQQAEFYDAVMKDDPRYELLPCCGFCGSDAVAHNDVRAALVCEDCGKENSSIEIRAGRIARRV